MQAYFLPVTKVELHTTDIMSTINLDKAQHYWVVFCQVVQRSTSKSSRRRYIIALCKWYETNRQLHEIFNIERFHSPIDRFVKLTKALHASTDIKAIMRSWCAYLVEIKSLRLQLLRIVFKRIPIVESMFEPRDYGTMVCLLRIIRNQLHDCLRTFGGEFHKRARIVAEGIETAKAHVQKITDYIKEQQRECVCTKASRHDREQARQLVQALSQQHDTFTFMFDDDLSQIKRTAAHVGPLACYGQGDRFILP